MEIANTARIERVNDIMADARALYQMSDDELRYKHLKHIEQMCYEIGEYVTSASISYQCELWKANNTSVHAGAIYKYLYMMLVKEN